LGGVGPISTSASDITRFVSGLNRALIILTICDMAIDMDKATSEKGEKFNDLGKLLASFFCVQASYKPRSRQEVLVEQMGRSRGEMGIMLGGRESLSPATYVRASLKLQLPCDGPSPHGLYHPWAGH
jgi:hypothetical protein